MTSHRLIRSTLPRLVLATTAIHHRARVDEQQEGRRVRMHWGSEFPGRSLVWTLEIEQGANGVLAHLTAEPSGGPLARLTTRWQRVALQALSARRLAELAHAASR